MSDGSKQGGRRGDKRAPPGRSGKRPSPGGAGNRAGDGHRGAAGEAKPTGHAAPRFAKAVSLPPSRPQYPDAWTAVVTPAAVNLVTVGHPWLFSGALQTLDAPTGADREPGGLCVVLAPDGRPLGLGLCNPQSQISVRMLGRLEAEQAPSTLPTLASLVISRLEAATALRRLIGRPAPDRTAYRLVHSEGDALPGLTIDRIGGGASVLVSAASGLRMLPIVADWLMGPGGCTFVVARAAHDAHPSEGLGSGTLLRRGVVAAEGAGSDIQQVQVGQALFTVDPAGGQKGGIFTDQLDNHLAVAGLAKGRFVIDAYCHHGGFGIQAALAGARRVLAIDASQKAVEAAQEAAKQSGVGERFEVVCGDAVHLLADLAAGVGAELGRPDLIVLDPPKFATSKDGLDDALRKYSHVNATAMAALERGGILVSCSCSGRVDRTTFLRMLGHAARRAGRDLQLLELRGAAMDHPSAPVHAEAHYLKVAICRVI